MEELNKGYAFTKAQIAELESLRAWKAEIEKQEPVAWWNGKETAFFEHETDGPVGEVCIPLYTTPAISPDVETKYSWLQEQHLKVIAENQSLKNEAVAWKESSKAWADQHDELAESFQCHPNKPIIEKLKAENVSLKLEQSMRKMAEQSNAKLLAENQSLKAEIEKQEPVVEERFCSLCMGSGYLPKAAVLPEPPDVTCPNGCRPKLFAAPVVSPDVGKLKVLSVTNIMIDVVPGEDGSGHEVSAKSVEDVFNLLNRLSENAEEYDLTTAPLKSENQSLKTELAKATSELEAARKDAEWKPIETAPFHVDLLVFNPETNHISKDYRSDKYAATWTHWNPLPVPPAIEQAKGGAA